MPENYHIISSLLQNMYCSRGKTAIQSADLARFDVEKIDYISRDKLSQTHFQRWLKLVDFNSSDVPEWLLEDAVRWGTCLKDSGKVWPCMPSRELTIQDRISFSTQQLYYYFDYLKIDGFFANCASEHIVHILNMLAQSKFIREDDIKRLTDLFIMIIRRAAALETIDHSSQLLIKDCFLSFLTDNHTKPFTSEEIKDIIENGWFKIYELSEAVPIDIIQKCMDNDRIYRIEPEYSASPVSGGVDVYFLGAPDTGKSCLISGLLSAVKDLPGAYVLNNNYAFRLINEHRDGIITPSTPYDTLVPLGVTINKKRSKTLFNVIEMDGESIMKIADSDCSGYNEIDLKAASSIINDNPKILFFIIDPTKDLHYEFFNQRQILCNIVDVLKRSEEIMNNILAIHIIVTKCDYLTHDVSVSNILNTNGYEMLIDAIKDVCKRHNINRKHNYTPRIVPFSVGKFYTTEFFVPESECSKNLLTIISGSIFDTRMKRFMNKIRRLVKK